MLFLFVCSKNSVSSEWVQRELAVAVNKRKHIIPFVCDESYNDDNIVMYIAHLDRIEYFKNQEKGIDNLIAAILNEKKEYEGIGIKHI